MATGSDDGAIRLWNLATGLETSNFVGYGEWASCGAISSQGDQLAAAGRDNAIRVWTLPDGKLLAELRGHTSRVESLAYLPGTNSLISTGEDRTLRRWDLASNGGTVLATHPLGAYCVTCSHDGRRLATACEDHNIYVWDVESRNQYACFSGHREVVECVAFSLDDARLASVGKDRTVRVWDVAKSTQVDSFIGHTERVWTVTWFPDNATLASAGADGTVRLWRCNTSRLERVCSFPKEVTRVWLPMHENRVWSLTRKGLYSIGAAKESSALDAPSFELPGNVSLADRVDVLAATSNDRRHVKVSDRSGPRLPLTIEVPIDVQSLALSPKGDLLAIGGTAGELQLYELPSCQLRSSLTTHRSGVRSIEFTADGDEFVVTSLGENYVAVGDVANATLRVVVDLAKLSPQLLCVAVSPNRHLLASGCADRAIRVWDYEQGTELTCLQGHDGVVQAAAFSPDGHTLSAGTSAGSVTFWHVATWQELGTFKTPLAAINDLAFSTDGNTLVIGGRTADDGGQVILWETKTVDQ